MIRKILLCLILVALTYSSSTFGYDYPSLTYSFAARQLISASKVMSNYNDILNGYTDGTRKANVAEFYIGGVLAIDDTRSYTGADGTFTGNLAVSGNGTFSGSLSADANKFYVVASTNRVGIGMSNPTTKLDVAVDGNGSAIAKFTNTGDSTPNGLIIDFTATPNDQTQSFLQCNDSTETKAAIYSDGSILASGGIDNSGDGYYVKLKVAEIGAWDMDSSNGIVKILNDFSPERLIDVSVVVMDDLQSTYYFLLKYNHDEWPESNPTLNIRPGSIDEIISVGPAGENTQLIINRRIGSDFDSSNFNDGLINRGWIYIQYYGSMGSVTAP